MLNFTFYNPTRIVFGKDTIATLADLVPGGESILMTYGGGSIKRNGVYDQVMQALEGREVVEFGGIEPNPRYETLMKTVALAKEKNCTFLLSVGGGSVLDGTKFIAAALRFENGDPWDILAKHAPVKSAVPLGCVLTLPATGSESNGNAVITRDSTKEKLAFISEEVFPRFAILDPETTYSLPERQTQNGIVDAFMHIMEQYMTCDVNAPVQARQAEGLLLTLIEEGPKVLDAPNDYDARANVMWAATQALNMLIGVGVPNDWATHAIGHELTAFYGVDHGRSLAVLFPAMLRHKREDKGDRILQYGERVWGITEGGRDARIDAAIEKTESFLQSLGVPTRLKDHGITEGLERIPARFKERGIKLGEHGDIGPDDIATILKLCAE